MTTNATSEPTYLSTEDLLRLAKDGFYFLQSLQSSDVQIPRDFTSSLAVASLVLRAADYDVGFFMRQLDDQISDVGGFILNLIPYPIHAYERGLENPL